MPREYHIEEEEILRVAHYIGTSVEPVFSDTDREYLLIKSLIEQAYERLYQATAVNWTEVHNPMVTDVVNGLCFISYYAMRDDAKNTTFLERYVNSRIFDLQMTDESTAARREQLDS